MEHQAGTIEARDLWSWDRSELPGPVLAREIRTLVVAKRRPSFDVIWKSPVLVKPPEDWRRGLTDTERLRLVPLVQTQKAIDRLPQSTLRELKDAMAMPVAEVLGVLAKIEALCWVAVPMPSAPSTVARQSLADVNIDQVFAEQVRYGLAAPWVAALEADDLRFPLTAGQNGRRQLSCPIPWICVRSTPVS